MTINIDLKPIRKYILYINNISDEQLSQEYQSLNNLQYFYGLQIAQDEPIDKESIKENNLKLEIIKMELNERYKNRKN